MTRTRRGSMTRGIPASLLLAAVLLATPAGVPAQAGGREARGGSGGAARDQALPTEVRALARLSAVLGRPTADSVVFNLLGDRDQEARVEYWPLGGSQAVSSAATALRAGVPAELAVVGLEPDREYAYRLMARAAGAAGSVAGQEGRFHTQRRPGSTFSFEIMGDSHPERPQQFDPELYVRNLRAAAADRPDFFMTIGDDFSVDTLASVTRASVEEVYRRQRLYLSLIGSVAPLFLVNGNHEQAALANLDGTAENVAVWAQNSRNAYFPQPAPDGFYDGDADPVPHIGLLRDYYSFTWGDALFLVIDPYWHSPAAVDNVYGGGEKARDPWNPTLGEAQYAWFRKTLEESRATYTFVFAHHVSGTGRGGIELAAYAEWGGNGPGGKDEFATRRPGWEAPIHDLMAEHRVTAFVQGHDHVFASQVLDGVAYVTLPEPADPNYALYNGDAFRSGDLLPNSGRVRFTIAPDKVTIEYIREWLPGDGPPGASDGTPAYRLDIPAGGAPGAGVVDARQSAGSVPAASDGPKPERDKAAPGTATGRSPQTAAGTPPAAERTQSVAAPEPAGSLQARTLVEYPGDGGAVLATAFLTGARYFYEYGEDPARLDRATPARTAAPGTVARDSLAGLDPGRVYYYRLVHTAPGETAERYGETGRFSTRKPPGTPFTFAVEADPHFDENSSGEGYRATLALIEADGPDFVVDLGDTSMAEKLARDAAGYAERDRLVRSYWDDIGGRVPFFMVIGNHDGEHGWTASGGRPTGAEAAALRGTWLLDTASAAAPAYDRYAATVYAVTWGDALVVVLDPYLGAMEKPGADGWDWTLGRGQYDWLAETLANTEAEYRFVFIHNMLGGTGKDARGGAAYAGAYEWGGGASGPNGFSAMRPGWPLPVHGLFVEYGVDVVFHGHDHFYAREEKDGVVYQLVPQPSLARPQALDPAELRAYGYAEGVFIPSPGYLRVSVGPESTSVEYVGSPDGKVLARYDIEP